MHHSHEPGWTFRHGCEEGTERIDVRQAVGVEETAQPKRGSIGQARDTLEDVAPGRRRVLDVGPHHSRGEVT